MFFASQGYIKYTSSNSLEKKYLTFSFNFPVLIRNLLCKTPIAISVGSNCSKYSVIYCKVARESSHSSTIRIFLSLIL